MPLPQAPRVRVLIVEDDTVDRIACRRAFAADRAHSFELLEAEHGEEGLERAVAERPDCILLDYNLPDLSGLEFIDRLDTALPGVIPVMMLTGADSAAVAAESMRRGARDYLVKDVDGHYLELLPGAIDRMLREQRLLDEKRRTEAELRESQSELRRLAAYQETIKEEERKRIAREIHDELGGLLTGIKAYISVAIERAQRDGREADPLLGETAGLAQTAIETVRRVISDLRPSVLDQLGVWPAVEWYTEQVAIRSGITTECRILPSAIATELDAERSTMVFRIAQEALTNVVRHAQATHASVLAEVVHGVLLLTVTDNGKGIEAGGLLSRDSWGILGMHERTRRFAGDLKVFGEPGQGTTLQLRLPLDQEQKQGQA
ncbi:response regulator [Massilia arenosa]|uniref:Response regulator n=1 Tax=Zemynaea arenosa TaxID=2561931 RepID=A0A4Y9SKE0_9BURK|nr:response regulator [Massilia arenosa]TFW23576.1 response regulator [Massilia arenosa]